MPFGKIVNRFRHPFDRYLTLLLWKKETEMIAGLSLSRRAFCGIFNVSIVKENFHETT